MKRRKAMSGLFNAMDITQALDGWAFEPGQINVRLICGNDGNIKLQLRLDLGVLQMEVTGRPDGKRPHRAATELDYQKRKLRKHQKKFGNDEGFQLSPRDCQTLREESVMFYHRYLSLFVLEQFQAVVRDTQHNIELLDFCHRYGSSEHDRDCMEQHRAYVLMMNTRAKACAALRQGYTQTAIAYLQGGIERIAELLPKEEEEGMGECGGRQEVLKQSGEAMILAEMLEQVRTKLPTHPRMVLQKQLSDAVAHERFEEAAKLRDRLAAMNVLKMAEGGGTPAKRPRKNKH